MLGALACKRVAVRAPFSKDAAGHGPRPFLSPWGGARGSDYLEIDSIYSAKAVTKSYYAEN